VSSGEYPRLPRGISADPVPEKAHCSQTVTKKRIKHFITSCLSQRYKNKKGTPFSGMPFGSCGSIVQSDFEKQIILQDER
jgi:hypothetical protein